MASKYYIWTLGCQMNVADSQRLASELEKMGYHAAENPDDACPTPWDYCCVSKDDLAKATVLVKVVDDQGKTRPEDARTLLGLKELQTVVVHGKAKRDDAGNLTVAAAGLFVRP